MLGNKVPGAIDRTTERSYLRVANGYLPDFLQRLHGPIAQFAPWLFGEDGIQIGPIPKGTPVGLLANLNVVPETRRSRPATCLSETCPRSASCGQRANQGPVRPVQRTKRFESAFADLRVH